jgi:TFIIF-interacting CTD phosphatase-like protein
MKNYDKEIGGAILPCCCSKELNPEFNKQSTRILKFASNSSDKQSQLNTFAAISHSTKTNDKDLNSTSQSIGLLKETQNNCSCTLPLITEITNEIEAVFQLIAEELPALSCEIKNLSVKLPSTLKKKTLVLDLDETLIYTGDQNSDITCSRESAIASLRGEDGEPFNITFYLRPHLRHFLTALSLEYEIIVNK